jgi:Chaperone of endosialidase
MDQTSEAILGLKPVTFQYKDDSTGIPQFGLIAEEVAKANPDLVLRDDRGEIYTVRYDAVNAMLVNEFLKEHRKVEEQQATIARMKKQIDLLTAGLQKVSDQMELAKAASQAVAAISRTWVGLMVATPGAIVWSPAQQAPPATPSAPASRYRIAGVLAIKFV